MVELVDLVREMPGKTAAKDAAATSVVIKESMMAVSSISLRTLSRKPLVLGMVETASSSDEFTRIYEKDPFIVIIILPPACRVEGRLNIQALS